MLRLLKNRSPAEIFRIYSRLNRPKSMSNITNLVDKLNYWLSWYFVVVSFRLLNTGTSELRKCVVLMEIRWSSVYFLPSKMFQPTLWCSAWASKEDKKTPQATELIQDDETLILRIPTNYLDRCRHEVYIFNFAGIPFNFTAIWREYFPAVSRSVFLKKKPKSNSILDGWDSWL